MCCWWSCPSYSRRVGVLYAPSHSWRCRHCTHVTYTSSNESDKRVTAAAAALLAGGFDQAGNLRIQLKAFDRIQARWNRVQRRRR